jgi:hypothetical protein
METEEIGLEWSGEVEVETYIFYVSTHVQSEGERSLDDAVLAFMENRTIHTVAGDRR